MEQIIQSTQLFIIQLKIKDREKFFDKDIFVEKKLSLTKLFPFVQEKLDNDCGIAKYYELDNNKRGKIGLNQRPAYKYVFNTRLKGKKEFSFSSINLLVFKDNYAYLLLTVNTDCKTLDELTEFNYFFAETKDKHNCFTVDENTEYTLSDLVAAIFSSDSYSYMTDLSEEGSVPDVRVLQMTQLSGESVSIQEASQYYDIHRSSYVYGDNEEEFIQRYRIVRPYRSLEFGVSIKGVSALCKTLGIESSDAFFSNQFQSSYFTNYMFVYVMLLHLKRVLLQNFSNYSNVKKLFNRDYVSDNYKKVQSLYFAFTEKVMTYQLSTPSFEHQINSFYNSLMECLEINSLMEKQKDDLKRLEKLLKSAKDDIKSDFSKKMKIISGLITFILSLNSAIMSLATIFIAKDNTAVSLAITIVGLVFTFIAAVSTFLILVIDTKGPKGKKTDNNIRNT